jgi:hypothetical protein
MARARLRFALAVLPVIGCSAPSAKSNQARSQRERDSVVGASQLPGAQGVRGAIRANDSAEARNARLDSLSDQP